MKQLVLLSLLIIVLGFTCTAQTKIIDTYVDFGVDPVQLTLYLTDSLVTNLSVKVGDSFGASNSIDSSQPINSATIADNMLITYLGSLSPGEYFFEVAITSKNETTQVIQFKTD